MTDFIEVKNDEVHLTVKGEENWQEIVINNELHLHLVKSKDGYTVDVYNYSKLEEPFEEDFITSTFVNWDDLTRYIDVNLVSTDGSDEEFTSEYMLVGDKLFMGDEKLLEDITETDDIVQKILDTEHEHVTSIELNGEVIYEDEDEE